MFEALEQLPESEVRIRHERIRAQLSQLAPQASGLLVFSRVHIYYCTGSAVAGVAWMPQDGPPVLLARKGIDRALLESPLEHVLPFGSFSQLQGLLADAGCPLGDVVAVEGQGLPWNLGQLLQAKLPDVKLVSGDAALARAQAVKSDWELDKMRRAGALHHQCIRQDLPKVIRPGMSEWDISLKVWDVFFAAGHCGLLRMNPGGEEVFLGHVAAGDSGNYPSAFNGPLGLRGTHPATPVMGSPAKVWQAGEPLSVDCGFGLDGYQTDLTQLYVTEAMPAQAQKAQDFCLQVQTRLAEALKPGAIPSELYAQCLQWAADAGLGESFMGLGANQVRFVGHGIGLVIDGQPVIAKGFDAPLEAGTTLALEPKVGVPGYGMVGVENTFVVAENGGECLTAVEGEDFSVIAV